MTSLSGTSLPLQKLESLKSHINTDVVTEAPALGG